MSNTPRFARKSMVVTGAAQGIGKQVAIDAAGEGALRWSIDLHSWRPSRPRSSHPGDRRPR
jgi:hypothetical protein